MVDKQIRLNGLKEFNTKKVLFFTLFKFNNYFDGLIGTDIMKELGIKIDFQKSCLEIQNVRINLNYKRKLISKTYTIPGNCKVISRVPVSIKSGSIHIKPIQIKNGLIIPEGIYKSENWYSLVEVKNTSDSSLSFVIEQPIEAQSIDENDFVEIHNFSFNNCSNSSTKDSKSIYDLIRTDHLNAEEQNAIDKLCKRYEHVFFQEGQDLTFCNQIKHEIKTTDEVPIYTKSYRFPYVHRQEIHDQIKKMLSQGIIRHSFSPWSSPIWTVPKKKDANGKRNVGYS